MKVKVKSLSKCPTLRDPMDYSLPGSSVHGKEMSPEYSVGLMLKLKLQYFGHVMRRTDSLGKTLMLRKIEGGKTQCRGPGFHSWSGN